MRKSVILLFFTALWLTAPMTYGDDPKELLMVRRQYVNEIKPISDRYLNNLEIMRRRYEQKSDKASVDAVSAEMIMVQSYLNRENFVDDTGAAKKEGSVAGKCMFFYPPDRIWFKIMYFRPDGAILGANNPAEMRWEQTNYNLLIMDEKGQITGTYRRVDQKDGRLYFENGGDGVVYVILEEPKG